MTRFILISPGPDGPNGAGFINNDRMNLSRRDITDLAVGDRIRLRATVEKHDADQCLLRMEPISTQLK
jgi:hypothetical protein